MGRHVWVVISGRYDLSIEGVYGSKKVARAWARRLGEDARVERFDLVKDLPPALAPPSYRVYAYWNYGSGWENPSPQEIIWSPAAGTADPVVLQDNGYRLHIQGSDLRQVARLANGLMDGHDDRRAEQP